MLCLAKTITWNNTELTHCCLVKPYAKCITIIIDVSNGLLSDSGKSLLDITQTVWIISPMPLREHFNCWYMTILFSWSPKGSGAMLIGSGGLWLKVYRLLDFEFWVSSYIISVVIFTPSLTSNSPHVSYNVTFAAIIVLRDGSRALTTELQQSCTKPSKSSSTHPLCICDMTWKLLKMQNEIHLVTFLMCGMFCGNGTSLCERWYGKNSITNDIIGKYLIRIYNKQKW